MVDELAAFRVAGGELKRIEYSGSREGEVVVAIRGSAQSSPGK